MRRLLLGVLAVVLGASPVWAGAPGDQQGRPGGRQGRPGGFRGGPGGPMMPGMTGRGGDRETDLFDVARRTVTVPEDKLAALENLALEYAVAENDAVAEVRRRLNKEYLVKVVALLPDEEKPKYEKVIAAMTERDDAIAAAEKELREALDKVKVAQGADKVAAPADPNQRFFRARPGEVPTRKYDALRSCFVLTDDQTKQVDVIHDANRDAVREKMRAQFANLRPADGGRPDPARMRQMGALYRQARDQADDEDAKAITNLLTDAQKKDFATVCTAMDAYRKKIADAEEACRAKVVAVVGIEKASALLGLGGNAAAGPAPAEKGTEF
ncbi:MAG TPA: Spy/CpxP family protein refolding chaperone [Planctomycetota bacterium]|nr:Spy/CpxP family protein refolding chaperone [Planctomycetota bacterium]